MKDNKPTVVFNTLFPVGLFLCWRCSLKGESQLVGFNLFYSDFIASLPVFDVELYYKLCAPNTEKRLH